MMRRTSIQMGEEGFAPVNEGPWAAAKRFAYLGAEDRVRVACLNECGRAPPMWFIRDVVAEHKAFRTHTGQLVKPKREGAVAPYSQQNEAIKLETQNTLFVNRLKRERALSDARKEKLSVELVDTAWDAAITGRGEL